MARRRALHVGDDPIRQQWLRLTNGMIPWRLDGPRVVSNGHFARLSQQYQSTSHFDSEVSKCQEEAIVQMLSTKMRCKSYQE